MRTKTVKDFIEVDGDFIFLDTITAVSRIESEPFYFGTLYKFEVYSGIGKFTYSKLGEGVEMDKARDQLENKRDTFLIALGLKDMKP